MNAFNDKPHSTVVTHSMTGYGVGSVDVNGVRLSVTIRSINSRFLDLVIKLPDCLQSLETNLRTYLLSRLRRGRVELVVTRAMLQPLLAENAVNHNWVTTMLALYQSLARQHNCLTADFSSQALLQLLRSREASLDNVMTVNTVESNALKDVTTQALDNLIESRQSEGQSLKNDLLNYHNELSIIKAQIHAQQADITILLKNRLAARLQTLLKDVDCDEQRLVQESAILADKADVSEEISRLQSHLDYFLLVLDNEPQGKKLEFIAQEIGREINTIAAKVQNAILQKLVIDAKSIVEKIREQCANIE